MKLGELIINIATKGDTKQLEKANRLLKESSKRQKDIEKYKNDLAKAITKEEKAQIKKNFADKIQAENLIKIRQGLIEQRKGITASILGFTKFVGWVSASVVAIDRLITSTAKANQQLITLSRTSGISLSTLNKYASASASVNIASRPEQVAQSLSNVASSLWDIRMGRGDISPYQELAFVGGKSISVWGKTVEQVVEEVREAIKGVGDVQATNIITRMGFSPDDLLMLRMSREEFEKINDLMLSPDSQEKLNKYGRQLQIIHLQINKAFSEMLIATAPAFNKLLQHVANIFTAFSKVYNKVINFADAIREAVSQSKMLQFAIKGIGVALFGLLTALNPVFGVLTALYLIIEDIAVFFMGGKSVFGAIFYGIQDFLTSIGDKISDIFDKVSATIEKMKFWERWTNKSHSAIVGNQANVNSSTNTNNDIKNTIAIYTNNTVDTITNGLKNYSVLIGENMQGGII